MSLNLRVDRFLVRTSGRSVRYALANLEAPAAMPREGRLPVNIAFVLDRSGSMAGEKISLAREGVITGIRSLSEGDRFAVVVFDDAIEVVVPSTPATASAKREAEQAVRGIAARGMTDLFGAWLSGCEQIGATLSSEGVNRCLLLTDGLANVGVTDHEEIVGHVRELARRGVATTTFGVGRDFDEILLEAMARAGNGNFYFIENSAQIPDFLTGEVGEALEVVASRVRLEVEAPRGVLVSSLSDLPMMQKGACQCVELGSLVSEQVLDVVLRIEFPVGVDGETVRLACSLSDRDGVFSGTMRTLEFAFAGHAENNRQKRDHEVDRVVAKLFAARARAAALECNRQGDFEGAKRELRGTARRIRGYAAGDPEMLRWAAELEEEQNEYGFPMQPLPMKQRHFAQVAFLRDRAVDGKARRRQDPSGE